MGDSYVQDMNKKFPIPHPEKIGVEYLTNFALTLNFVEFMVFFFGYYSLENIPFLIACIISMALCCIGLWDWLVSFRLTCFTLTLGILLMLTGIFFEIFSEDCSFITIGFPTAGVLQRKFVFAFGCFLVLWWTFRIICCYAAGWFIAEARYFRKISDEEEEQAQISLARLEAQEAVAL